MQGRRFVAQDGTQNFGRGVASERAGARQHLVDDGAQTEHVRARVERLPLRLFGRHVRGGAGHHTLAGPRHVRVCRHDLGQAEVEHLGATVVRDEDVGRLEIAVEDALLMSGMEGVGDLHGQASGFLRRQRAPQRRPVQELQDEIARPDVVDLADVRVIQRRDGARLLLEAADAVGVGVTPGRQNLDCDVAAEARVMRAVDLAHSAPAEECHDVVRAKARPRRQHRG